MAPVAFLTCGGVCAGGIMPGVAKIAGFEGPLRIMATQVLNGSLGIGAGKGRRPFAGRDSLGSGTGGSEKK